ncbi:alpha/beta hydrolase (plasmid) [Streptomyces sp. BI20]|uniref:alpha/beta hydrolase n=1 Tax=Streptomyces sp. BI20 TaxID=3403460 RepID=UPI003C70EC99
MGSVESALGLGLNGLSWASARLAARVAYGLFHRPLVHAPLRPAEEELLREAHTEHLRIGGRHVVVHRWGDGRNPVVLVHGWRSRGTRFASWIVELTRRGHSVLTFDAPGHGDSPGRSTTIHDYRQVLTALHARYGRFHGIVAHSLGVLATGHALCHGVRVERVVAVAGVCDFSYPVALFSDTLRLRPRLRHALRRRIARTLFPDAPLDAEFFSTAERARELPGRWLLVHDVLDEVVRPAQAHRLAGALGDRARLVVTEGLGHRRILGDPDVVRASVAFLCAHAPLPADPRATPDLDAAR